MASIAMGSIVDVALCLFSRGVCSLNGKYREPEFLPDLPVDNIHVIRMSSAMSSAHHPQQDLVRFQVGSCRQYMSSACHPPYSPPRRPQVSQARIRDPSA